HHCRLPLPAELAGHPHPGDRRAGVTHRDLRRLSLVGLLDQYAVALRSGRGRRDCGGRSSGASHRGGLVSARGHDPGDEGGLGPRDRHRADPLFGLRARGVYWWHSGSAEQAVRGDDCDLRQNLQKFLAACRRRPELAGVASQFTASVPQLYADVDRDKVLKQGVAVADVYQTLQAYLGGLYLNQFNRFGRQWRVYLQAEGEERRSDQDIQNYFVRNIDG